MFFGEFCEISKNAFFTEHPWATASLVLHESETSKYSTSLFRERLVRDGSDLYHVFNKIAFRYLKAGVREVFRRKAFLK